MIWETSVQARFLVPMAISLGFGIIWTTFVILLTVPALYVILEDFKAAFAWLYGSPSVPDTQKTESQTTT